jgi:hypothetical protein
MKRTYWILGACLSLLLIGGTALEVSAQQTSPPAAPPSATTPDSSPSSPTTTPPAAPGGAMQRDNPSATTPPPGNTQGNTQIETRSTERTTVVDRDGGRIFGVQPAVALVIGAAVLVVIVIGLVAMSRRSDEVTHTHRV